MPTDHLRKEHPGDKSFKDSMTWQKWGFLKMGTPTFIQFIGHFFGGGNERVCHLMMIELCKQSMSDALLSSRLSCSSLLWSPEGNPAPIFGLSEKGLPWIPKFLKSNGSIMILPSLSDRLTMGYPISVYTRRQWHVDILSLSLSLSLSPLGKLPWVSL